MKVSYKVKKLEKNRTESLFTNDMTKCYLCGMHKQHIHEVIFGKNRQNSMKYGLYIPVCNLCHNYIHSNSEIQLKHKIKAQQLFEEHYDLDFLTIFKRNYK